MRLTSTRQARSSRDRPRLRAARENKSQGFRRYHRYCCDITQHAALRSFEVSLAIDQIVTAYVRLKDRDSLEELKTHRLKLMADLNRLLPDFDSSPALRDLAEDLAAIDAGFERLDVPVVQGER